MNTKEYDQLYSEIARNSQICSNIFLGNISVTAILIGFGLEYSNSLLFLSPFAMIIPSLLFIASQMESTTRIASYIKIFHEKTLEGPKWETRWYQLRYFKCLPCKRKYSFSISGLYGLLGFTCFLLSILYWDGDTASLRGFFSSYLKIGLIILPLIALLIISIRLIIRAFSLSLSNDYDKAWNKVKNKDSEIL